MRYKLLVILALLVGHSAGSLARRLAGSLALAATALGRTLLQSSAVESLDMLHSGFPSRRIGLQTL